MLFSKTEKIEEVTYKISSIKEARTIRNVIRYWFLFIPVYTIRVAEKTDIHNSIR